MTDIALEQTSEASLLAGHESEVISQLSAQPRERSDRQQHQRWGVILAGGDGTRLRELTRLIYGDDRPKQFCAVVGSESLLEQTRKRAERSIPRTQILYPLSASHRDYYLHEFGIPRSQRIIQPANKGTAPAILLSLISIAQQDEEAVVAILPSDHHYTQEGAFTSALEAAFALAAHRPHSVVILGAHPHGPEVEYGWIELGHRASGGKHPAYYVRGFREKPSIHAAHELLSQGALWNTFVMVGRVSGFLEMTAQALPDLMHLLNKSDLWKGSELQVPDSLYQEIAGIDFSKRVLSVQTRSLLALPLERAGWSDLGHPDRVVSLLRKEGDQPPWLQAWLEQTDSEGRESSGLSRAAHE